MTKPHWLTRGAIALHNNTAFIPVQLKTDGKQKFAIDGLNNLYLIDELEPATPDSFKIPHQFILKDGAVVTVERTTNGLSINGIERVRIPDEVDIACRSLAQMFDGAIVKDVNLARFGIVEDTSDEDW
jgi:hypothetical protein